MRRKLSVGLNYPQYENWTGMYFGPNHRINPTQVPPNINDAANQQWRNDFETLLGHYKLLGVKVFRVFLLGNAWNYGTGSGSTFESPDASKNAKFWRESYSAYETHMEWLLQAAEAQDVKLIPSLISFTAFYNGPGNGSRSAIISDANNRALFFDLFRVLLAVSTHYRSTILAWEVVNEPVWVTQTYVSRVASSVPPPFPSLWNGTPTVSLADMTAFLNDGVSEIASCGFDYTNGHNFERTYSLLTVDCSDDTTFPVPASVTPAGAKKPRVYMPQFHFYPDGVTRSVLDPHGSTHSFLGEVSSRASVARSPDPEHFRWSQLNGVDATSGRDAVFHRLAFSESLGYPMVCLWPDGLHHMGTNSIMSSNAELGIVDYLTKKNPYP